LNTRKIGTDMEMLAAGYLISGGMEILEKNFYTRQGEIDIIGMHEGYLVFVEVKYRKSTRYGEAEAAVDIHKQRRICKAADYYRYIHHYGDDTAVRYDVLAIQGDEVHWIKNAFQHIYTGKR